MAIDLSGIANWLHGWFPYHSEVVAKNQTNANASKNLVTDSSGEVTTENKVSVGSNSGLSMSNTNVISHSNSVTGGELTTSTLKKVKYDGQGHITETANPNTTDLPNSETYSNIGSSLTNQKLINDGINSKLGTITSSIESLASTEYIKIDTANSQGKPSTTASSSTMNTIYLVKNGSGLDDNYDEFITVRSGTSSNYTYAWEKIGTTSLDLSNYIQKGSGTNILLVNGTNTPQSSFATSGHTHGNLQNNGQVGSTAQANYNVVTDSNGKITTEAKPTIDSALSTTSTNAVQNKKVKEALDLKANTSDLSDIAFSGDYNDLDTFPTLKVSPTFTSPSGTSVVVDTNESTDTISGDCFIVFDMTNSYSDSSTMNISIEIDGVNNVASNKILKDIKGNSVTYNNVKGLTDLFIYVSSGYTYTLISPNFDVPSHSHGLIDSDGILRTETGVVDSGKVLMSDSDGEIYGSSQVSDGKIKHTGKLNKISNINNPTQNEINTAINTAFDNLSTTLSNMNTAISGKASASDVPSDVSDLTDTNSLISGKAPINHASSSTTYGVGTTSNYGHNKVINDVTHSSFSNGESLSAYQGYVLKGLIDAKASASDIPTDVSDLTDTNDTAFTPKSHAHGYIRNDGSITEEKYYGSSDYLVIADVNDSYKLKNAPFLPSDFLVDPNSHSNIGSNNNAMQSTINTKIDTALSNKADASDVITSIALVPKSTDGNGKIIFYQGDEPSNS